MTVGKETAQKGVHEAHRYRGSVSTGGQDQLVELLSVLGRPKGNPCRLVRVRGSLGRAGADARHSSPNAHSNFVQVVNPPNYSSVTLVRIDISSVCARCTRTRRVVWKRERRNQEMTDVGTTPSRELASMSNLHVSELDSIAAEAPEPQAPTARPSWAASDACARAGPTS